MRACLLLILIVLFPLDNANQASQQPEKGTVHHKQPIASTSPPAQAVVEKPTSKEVLINNTAPPAEQTVRVRALPPVSVSRNWADWTLWVASAVLAIVGILGICVAVRTLKALKLQSVILRRQTSHIARQARSMRYQTTILRNTALSTKTSADAARDTVEIIISKERARLKVDLDKLDLTPLFGAYTVQFNVSIFGTTPAFITQSGCTGYVMPWETVCSPEADPMMFSMTLLPSVIVASSLPIKERAFFLFGDSHIPEMLEEIKADRLFVGVRGFIKYRDVFDREHEVKFRYVWKYATWLPATGGNRWGDWEKCGAEQDNIDS